MTTPPIPETLLANLKQLSETVGMAGNETAVRQLIRTLVTDLADTIEVDSIGNLYATKKGTGEQPFTVMAAAHMDEVGLMVVSVDDGLATVRPVGGLDPRVLIGKPVWVGADKLPGVILAKPVHLLDNYTSVPTVDSLKIDLGPNAGKVSPGDWATFAMAFADLGPTVRGKALDDRVGCALLIELLRHGPYPFDFVAAFTVQEEIGLRGAKVAAYRVNPDFALVLEATPAVDLPAKLADDENERYNTRLFHGPALSIGDGSTLYQRHVVNYFEQVARDNNIPVQRRQPGAGGNDSGAIHRARGGIPTQAISVPARYIHSPAALIAAADLQHTLDLAVAALRSLTRDVFTQPTPTNPA